MHDDNPLCIWLGSIFSERIIIHQGCRTQPLRIYLWCFSHQFHSFHIFLMIFPSFLIWFSSCFPFLFLSFSDGVPTGFSHFSHGFSFTFPMVFPWFSHGFSWFSHGFPMVFPCFPMVFPWFSQNGTWRRCMALPDLLDERNSPCQDFGDFGWRQTVARLGWWVKAVRMVMIHTHTYIYIPFGYD